VTEAVVSEQIMSALWIAGTVITMLIAICGMAQDPHAPAAGPGLANGTASGTNHVSGPNLPEQTQPTAKQPATSVEEILKMMEAGVSKDVIKVYVENSRSDYAPTAQDLIALKQHGVPDEITTTLVKRSAEVAAQKPQTVAGSAMAPTNLDHGELDPEGYSFFQRYYLFPRTLGYVYDRLSVNYAQGSSGYYYPACPPFGSGYGYPGRFVLPGTRFHFYPASGFPLAK